MMTSIIRKLTQDNLSASRKLKVHWNNKKGGLGLTQAKIADQLDITQGMFSQMLNGHVAIPKYMLLRIAKILELNPNEIDSSVEEDLVEIHTIPRPSDMFVRVPVLFTLNDDKPKESFVEVSSKHAPKNSYAVEVKGDKYAPFLKEGTCAIIDPSESIERGDKVFVRFTTNSSILAIYNRYEDGRMYFDPLVPGAPHVEEGYNSEDVITVHYLYQWHEPRK